MAPPASTPSPLPRLSRLLTAEALAAVCAPFAALAPGLDLAVLDQDGRRVAGTTPWPPAPQPGWPALLSAADQARTEAAGEVGLWALRVDGHLVGLIAARPAAPAAAALAPALTLALAQAVARREVARETLDRYREINLLYRAGETIGARLDPAEILHLVLAEAERVVAAEVGLALVGGSPETLTPKASLGAADEAAHLQAEAGALVRRVVATGQPDIAALGDPVAPAWAVCVPLRVRERILGCVLLGRRPGAQAFTAGDEKLVLALAQQAAISLETVRLHQEEVQRQRLEGELAIGRRIQLSLLPERHPVIAGWEFATYYRAADQVGGDFYDVIPLPGAPARLGMVIADVTGKGVPAALMMAYCRAIIRTEALSNPHPEAVLRRVNQLLNQESRSRLFLSALFFTVTLETGEVTLVSGGHDYPYRVPAVGRPAPVISRGVVLGAFPEAHLEPQTFTLAPGEALVCYTDGVTEAMNPARALFGEERLEAALLAQAGASATELSNALVGAIDAFAAGAPPADDLTLLVIKRRAPDAAEEAPHAAQDPDR